MILIQNDPRVKSSALAKTSSNKDVKYEYNKILFRQMNFLGLITYIQIEFGCKAPSILAALSVSKMIFILDPYLSNHRRLIFTTDDFVDDNLRTKSEDFLERIYFHSVSSVDTAEGTKFNMSNVDLFLYTKEPLEVAVIVTLTDLDGENA